MPPTYPDLVPVLTDDVVTLRALGPSDLDAVVEQSRDPEAVRWTTIPDRYERADALAFLDSVAQQWETGDRAAWAIEVEGRFAGLVTHRRRLDTVRELSFVTHPAHRGRGVMTRAGRLCLAHAFEAGAEAVLWHAAAGNFGSRRVAWRLGFAFGGTTTQATEGALREVWSGVLRRGEPMEPRTRWLTAPTLEGRGVRIRPFHDDDGARMPSVPDPLAAAFSAGLPSADGFARWLLAQRTRAAEGSALACAIADARTDELLGGLDLYRLDLPTLDGTALHGFWLLPDARGRGVLNAALDVFLPWAFRSAAEGGLGLHQISAGCSVTNLASARVLRRAGFRPIGTERRSLQVDGEATDALLFDLLDTDDREAQRVQPSHVPVLETARFRLRPWRDSDVPGPDEGPDQASAQYVPAGAVPDAESFAAWVRRRRLFDESGDKVEWCVADRESDRALGSVMVFGMGAPADRFQGELGYWLYPTSRGRGVLAEVLPVVVDHAFAPVADGGLGLTRLHAGTVRENRASQAALLRVGFRLWGEDRQAWRNGVGELTDGAYYELLSSDPRPDSAER